MATYSEKLKDPRWQRRRLHMLEAAAWKCSACQSEHKTLHVHHKLYRKGADPWEYEDRELAVLCDGCHAKNHEARDLLDTVLMSLSPDSILKVAGYAHVHSVMQNAASHCDDPILLGLTHATMMYSDFNRSFAIVKAIFDMTQQFPTEAQIERAIYFGWEYVDDEEFEWAGWRESPELASKRGSALGVQAQPGESLDEYVSRIDRLLEERASG